LALIAAKEFSMSFEEFGFLPPIRHGIKSAGFKTPTPVQREAIPLVIEGHDVMGLAQTGTGKTAAFVLPIFQRLLSGKREEGQARHRGQKARALILAPTRELAEQIRGDISSLGRRTGLKALSIYGGVGMGRQVEGLRAGTDIIVACPGRLMDHLRQGTVDLSRMEVLVIDEADRMLDMGFIPDVKRIIKLLPAKRQTLLFSATMPDYIRRLAKEFMTDPASVQVGRPKPADTVSHTLYPVEAGQKSELLISLLKKTDTDSVLVFTRTRTRTKKVAEQLKKAGFSAASLEGGMPQSKRQAAMQGFRSGKFNVLVATDIAARGVDVSGISHVINYDMPDTADAYTHRIGRTGRAERMGKAFTLVTREDGPTVRAMEREMDVELVSCELEGFNYVSEKPAPPPASSRRPMNGRRSFAPRQRYYRR
jgi:ATP-dependent RNA helicase RhlE